MKLNLISTQEILDVEKTIGVELIVTERAINAGSPARLERYYVDFERSEVMDGGMLIGKCGNGNTIDGALIDYCSQVSNCRIAVRDGHGGRRDIDLPKLVHTKLLGR